MERPDSQNGHARRKLPAARSPKKDAATKSRSPRPRRVNAVQVKPPPPITQRGQATRRRLKAALTQLLQGQALQDIRLEDITREAGVRVSLFYHYFQSKIDITQEVLADVLDTFRSEVSARPKDDNPLSAIHYANQRMVALYATNPGAMRCLFEVQDGMAPFAPMWRDLTLDWNQRIAASIARQFPQAFCDQAEYLALAYALSGTADMFLLEYYVHKNPVLKQAHPSDEDVARFVTTLWYRALYLKNPPDAFLGRLRGFRRLGDGSTDRP